MEVQPIGHWKTAFKVLLIVLALTLGYAIVRYNIVRSVPATQIPLFINNKAIALSSVIMIGLSFFIGPLARFWPNRFVKHLGLRKPLGILGFGLAALHSFISLILLKPAYYQKFFDVSGKLNTTGEFSLLFGVLALLIFSGIVITSLPPIEANMTPATWKSVQRLGYLAYFFVLLHVAIMGYKGWQDPASYQFGLISISLLAALFIILVLLARLLVIIFPRKR